jgi:chromate reductase, NAD(P)H dehydrogenase (quinone)
MRRPKILVFAGSVRTGSFNGRLAALAAKELALLAAEVTRISLADYPLPLYDGDTEAASGVPDNAMKLKQQFAAHHGIFIASPEYNASITPLLKNTLDWISRVREGGEPPRAAFRDRVFALGAASNGTHGGYRSLIALRHVLELGCGALVLPDQVAIRNAANAFDEVENLRDAADAERLRSMLARLVDVAHQYALP